jgi:hypothetical protein
MNSIVEKRNSGSLAVVNLREDSRKGAEEIKQEDVSTPLLKILHQLSPECNERDPKYVNGSKPGMIYASSLGKLIDGEKDGINIVIAHAQTRFPEWQERGDSASAPVGTHVNIPEDAVEERNGRYRLPNGNYVEKTAYFYVIVIMGDEYRPAVIPMRSSNLSPARELNNLITNLRVTDDKGTFQPATYSAMFNLKTVGKTAGSKSWHVYKPSKIKMLDTLNQKDADLYRAGSELQKTVVKGNAKPKYEKRQSTEGIV